MLIFLSINALATATNAGKTNYNPPNTRPTEVRLRQSDTMQGAVDERRIDSFSLAPR